MIERILITQNAVIGFAHPADEDEATVRLTVKELQHVGVVLPESWRATLIAHTVTSANVNHHGDGKALAMALDAVKLSLKRGDVDPDVRSVMLQALSEAGCMSDVYPVGDGE